MSSGKQLKQLTRARIKSTQILIKGNDWEGAAYMMGYVLETALKAASCRSLRLTNYPDDSNNRQTTSMFKTHNFDQLLTVSGLSDIFSPITGLPIPASNWSQFTQEYPGEWPKMRYNPDLKITFTKEKVIRLSNILFEDSNSIITIIGKKQRW